MRSFVLFVAGAALVAFFGDELGRRHAEVVAASPGSPGELDSAFAPDPATGGWDARVSAVVDQLAAGLAEDWSPVLWEHALWRTTVLAGLDGADAVRLLERAARRDTADERRLVLVELARVLLSDGTPPAPLSSELLTWLGPRVHGTRGCSLERAAAARSLVFFGAHADRKALIGRLRDPAAGQERECAAWALAGARDEQTGLALAVAIDAAQDPVGLELATTALVGLLARAEPDRFSRGGRARLENTLVTVVEHPHTPRAGRLDGLRALALLGGPRARATLLRMLRGTPLEPELARVAAAELAHMEAGFHLAALADAMLDEAVPQAARDLIAAELVRTPRSSASSPVVHGLALARVQRIAAAAPSARARGEALALLADSGDPAALATLAHAAWADADADVRADAIVALDRADTAGTWTHVLVAQSREDPSQRVREVAARALLRHK